MAEHKDFHIKDGKKYWSTSTCLKLINQEDLNKLRDFKGDVVMDQILVETAGWGDALHDVAKDIFLEKGFYVSDSNDPVILNLVKKFQKFCVENIVDIKFYEKQLFSDKYLYTGRMDGLYLLKGKKGYDLCDIKTGTKRRNTEALQLAAYKNLCIENGIEVNDRIIIQCKRDDSPCKAVKIETPYKQDFADFLYTKHLYLRFNK